MLGVVDDGITATTTGNPWYKPDGSINYPPNYGAVVGSESIVTLQPGTKLGRYGGYGRSSSFVTLSVSSPNSLSLPPSTNPILYQEFTVKKTIPQVTQSVVAQWPLGSETGGGMQFKLPMTIEELLMQGYIE